MIVRDVVSNQLLVLVLLPGNFRAVPDGVIHADFVLLDICLWILGTSLAESVVPHVTIHVADEGIVGHLCRRWLQITEATVFSDATPEEL